MYIILIIYIKYFLLQRKNQEEGFILNIERRNKSLIY